VNERKAVICEVLTTVTTKITVLYNVTPCSIASYYQCFGGSLCVLIQGRIIFEKQIYAHFPCYETPAPPKETKKAPYLKLLKWNPGIFNVF